MIAEELPQADTPARSVVGEVVPWFALGAAAVVLLALYAHPLLALSVFCLKFAVTDFLTAAWLFRNDPDRTRGRACALLYLTAGVWKAVLVNYGLLTAAVVFTALAGEFAWPHPPTDRDPDFLDDGLIPWAVPAAAGYLLAIVLGSAAVSVASRSGQRLWLGTAAHGAWLRDRWPPENVGRNWLAFGPGMALAFVPLVVGLAGLVASRLFPTPMGLTPSSWNSALTIHWIGGLLLAFPPMMLVAVLHDRDRPCRLARSPADCWGKTEGEKGKGEMKLKELLG
jgi:hypothetical protein